MSQNSLFESVTKNDCQSIKLPTPTDGAMLICSNGSKVAEQSSRYVTAQCDFFLPTES